MLAIPTNKEREGGDAVEEGDTDENPICLSEPFMVWKFDNLMIWFYK
jgi:hypothetical protein